MESFAADMKFIGKNFKNGLNSIFSAKKIEIGDNVTISDNVKIIGEGIRIGSNSEIQSGVYINSKRIIIGEECKIEHSLKFCGYGGGFEKDQADEFVIGDNSFLGNRSRITIPSFITGDYSILHNNLSIYGNESLIIGHNVWIGQETIINTRKAVTMGNNVRMGARTQIWSHSSSGELLEGCLLFSEKPVVLEDNTWLNGGVTISPGIRMRSWSVALIGSVITKDTEEYHLYAGVPAKDITDKIQPYKKISLDEKFDMMMQYVKDFITKRPEYAKKIFLFENSKQIPPDLPDNGVILILKDAQENFKIKNNSVFDLKTKKYRKLRSRIEIDFIKEHLGHRARFIPLEKK